MPRLPVLVTLFAAGCSLYTGSDAQPDAAAHDAAVIAPNCSAMIADLMPHSGYECAVSCGSDFHLASPGTMVPSGNDQTVCIADTLYFNALGAPGVVIWRDSAPRCAFDACVTAPQHQ